eukprot:2816264-Rhodomonas_salina.1
MPRFLASSMSLAWKSIFPTTNLGTSLKNAPTFSHSGAKTWRGKSTQRRQCCPDRAARERKTVEGEVPRSACTS